MEIKDSSVASKRQPTEISIAIVIPNLRGGGAERVSIDLAHALSALGYGVVLVLAKAVGELLPEAERHFSVIDLGCSRMRQVPHRLSQYLRTSSHYAAIVNMWPLTSVATLAWRMAGDSRPMLLVEHGMLSQQYQGWGWFHNLVMRLTLALSARQTGRVAAVSKGAAGDLAKLAFLETGQVSVIGNPVPARPLSSGLELEAARGMWKCEPGGRLLTVGTLKTVKNQELLLRAFSLLRAEEAHLVVVGGGDEEARLRSLAVSLDIGNRVTFAGFQVDPTPFYQAADLFVLSSNSEGLPTVLIESLSFGLPVVSTDCPSGPAEILENGKWGRLVPVGDAEALARAIEEALVAPVDRDALKRRAADFSPEIAARKYLDALGLA